MSNQIIEILSNESIEIINVRLGFKTNNILEIKLKDKEEYLKWNYFSEKVKEEKIAEVRGNYPNIKYMFFNYLAEENQATFLNLLKKQYYKVNPTKRNFNVLIKPTNQCNFNCKYCYDKPYRDSLKNNMSLEMIDKIMELLSKYASEIQFIWHGGEPTLMTPLWYERVFEEIVPKYPMTKFSFSIMSNGSNYNEEYMKIFKKYNIETGASFNAHCQAYLRSDADAIHKLKPENNIDDKIFKNILDYNAKGQNVGVIDVITKANYKNQIEIYEFYKKYEIGVAMNHVFHTSQTEKNDLEMSANEYGKEFKKFFKYWLYDENGVHERTVVNALKMVIGNRKVTCSNSDCRYRWLGVNSNGDIYPCDRYYPKKYKAGNIMQYNSIEEIFNSPAYKKYADDCQIRFDTHCKECGYFDICKGGCNANSVETTGSAKGVDPFYCEMFKKNFQIVYDEIRNLDIFNAKLNPVAKDLLIKNNFYSIKDIKNYIKKSGKNIKMEYEKEDLLNCSEYKIFRGVNPIKNDEKSVLIGHSDFIITNDKLTEKEIIEHNEKKREKKFYEAIAKLANKVVEESKRNVS